MRAVLLLYTVFASEFLGLGIHVQASHITPACGIRGCSSEKCKFACIAQFAIGWYPAHRSRHSLSLRTKCRESRLLLRNIESMSLAPQTALELPNAAQSARRLLFDRLTGWSRKKWYFLFSSSSMKTP